MGFSDRLRSWLKGESKRNAPSRSTDKASRASTSDLEAFATSRTGVEAFLEPKTAIYSTTILLVAHDGEYLRRPVKDRKHAGEFCKELDLPLYDAAKVGYPKRMRDYERGQGPRHVDLSELPPWPGDEGAGDADPGDDGPGVAGPGDEVPGNAGPGDEGPAGEAPDEAAPGREEGGEDGSPPDGPPPPPRST